MSTIKFNANEKLFVEKYRPSTINDCILAEKTEKEFKEIVKQGHIPNLMFYGPPGSGKTTAARALCNDLGLDYIIINTSNERGIDTLRDTITSFASSVSLTDRGKCIILDEFDHSSNLLQAGLRAATEEFSKSCSFILTANYPNKIIPALHSRFVGVDFGANAKELESMQARFFMRVLDILNNEEIEFDENVVVAIIQKYFPDNRKILGILQQFSRFGKIDESALVDLTDVNINTLISCIKEKKFKQIVQWAEDNKDNDLSSLYEELYKTLRDWVVPGSIPDAIMIINEAQRWDSTVPSKELHLSAMAVEMMTSLEFK